MKFKMKKIIILFLILLFSILICLGMIITGSIFLAINHPNLNLQIHDSIFYGVLIGAILVGIGLLNFFTMLIIVFILISNNKSKIKEIILLYKKLK